MKGYFFVITALPALNVGLKPEINFQALLELFEENLTSSDLKKVYALRQYIDFCNVERFLKGEPLDRKGNLNEKEFEEALLNQEILPKYLFDFLNEFDTKEEQLQHFPRVYALYYKESKQKYRGFLRKYLAFERRLRLVLTGYRCKKLGLDLLEQLQYEDLNDDLVMEILAQKDHPQFEFPFEFLDLQELLEGVSDDPLDQYQMILRYRFEKIGELTIDEHFSIDLLLSYMVQLIILEEYYDLDERKGEALLNQL